MSVGRGYSRIIQDFLRTLISTSTLQSMKIYENRPTDVELVMSGRSYMIKNQQNCSELSKTYNDLEYDMPLSFVNRGKFENGAFILDWKNQEYKMDMGAGIQELGWLRFLTACVIAFIYRMDGEITSANYSFEHDNYIYDCKYDVKSQEFRVHIVKDLTIIKGTDKYPDCDLTQWKSKHVLDVCYELSHKYKDVVDIPHVSKIEKVYRQLEVLKRELNKFENGT
jgi:hypothetical protein